MQPNQPFSPASDQNQNNEPAIEPTEAPAQWNDTQPVQPTTPQQPAMPIPTEPIATPQPVIAEYARYQPQPLQTPAPAPTPQMPATDYAQQPQAPAQPEYAQPTPQQYSQADQYAPAQPVPAVAQRPKSQFELEYEAALQEPPRKKSHKGIIIASIITLLVLLAGGAAAYLWMQDQNDPEKRFYRAIENHLSTTYIQQDYKQVMNMGGEMTATIKATSDFTNPKMPKSHIKFDMSSSEAVSTAKGELTILDDKEYFGKLTADREMTGVDSQYLPVTDQWYRIDKDDFGSTMLLDIGSLSSHINTPTGEVLVGNFNEATRTDLMQFIREKGVYSINSSKDATIDGQKTTQYDITFNTDALNELNKKALKALGLSTDNYSDQIKNASQTNILWINNETNRIVKVELTRDSHELRDDGKNTKDTSTITLSYPSSVPQIAKPADAKDVPWKNF
jgi:hypothetical protein